MKNRRKLLSINLELTARCNNNCRHCYINLPAADKEAKASELTLPEIHEIADHAVSLGALWCLLTGGEPLLRDDFFDIYLALKKKGLLVSVFTNATLLTQEHIAFFKKYPPRNLEVSVYGVTRETYEAISRVPGSHRAFLRGMDRIRESGLPVRLKTMALKSNFHELEEIARFCRQYTSDYYRFDPFLHLRYDRNPTRNQEIVEERLSPREIVELETTDQKRFEALKKNCDDLIFDNAVEDGCNHLFRCRAGADSCVISPNGIYRLCYPLWHPDTVYDLREGSLTDAFEHLVLRVHALHSDNREYLHKCRTCNIINLCMWCPATAYLETGRLDEFVDFYCKVAKARAEMLAKSTSGPFMEPDQENI